MAKDSLIVSKDIRHLRADQHLEGLIGCFRPVSGLATTVPLDAGYPRVPAGAVKPVPFFVKILTRTVQLLPRFCLSSNGFIHGLTIELDKRIKPQSSFTRHLQF